LLNKAKVLFLLTLNYCQVKHNTLYYHDYMKCAGAGQCFKGYGG